MTPIQGRLNLIIQIYLTGLNFKSFSLTQFYFHFTFFFVRSIFQIRLSPYRKKFKRSRNGLTPKDRVKKRLLN